MAAEFAVVTRLQLVDVRVVLGAGAGELGGAFCPLRFEVFLCLVELVLQLGDVVELDL